MSKLWYTLRAEKDRWSTLNQGTGVWCFDTWVGEVRKGHQGKEGPPIIGQMHDEIICQVGKGRRERLEKHLRDAMERANMKLGLNIKLDIDIQFGEDYASVH